MLRSEDFNLSECWPSMCPYTSISTYTANSEMPSNTQSTTKKKQLTMSVMVKKTKDVTGCKVLSHPTTKQIQSFLRTLCHSTWRSARSSPARSLGRFKRVVLLQLEIGAKKHEVFMTYLYWMFDIETLTNILRFGLSTRFKVIITLWVTNRPLIWVEGWHLKYSRNINLPGRNCHMLRLWLSYREREVPGRNPANHPNQWLGATVFL